MIKEKFFERKNASLKTRTLQMQTNTEKIALIDT